MTVVLKYTGEIKNLGEATIITKEMMEIVNMSKMKKKKNKTLRSETDKDKIIKGVIEEEETDKITITSKGENSKMRMQLKLINKMINIEVGTRKTISVGDTKTIIIKTKIKNMIKDLSYPMTLIIMDHL